MASAIKLHATAGAAQTIDVLNSAGTTDGTESGGAVALTATLGGMGLSWNDGKDLWAEGGRAIITANEDAAEAIKLHADAGTNQTIVLVNDAGTDDAAIALTSSAGGITATCNDDKTISLENASADTYIKLNANSTAASETIQLVNAGGNGAAAIGLTSTAGGITLTTTAANKDIMLNCGPNDHVKVSGHLSVTGNAEMTSVTCTSDKRYKKNIRVLTDADLDKLMNVTPVCFNFIDTDPDTFSGGLKFGVIAQEINEIFPNMVNTDNADKFSVEYQQLVAFIPLLYKKIKTLEKKVDKM